MRAHFFQHVPFEGLGSIASWLEQHSVDVTSTKFFEASDLPRPADLDLLIVMGGPMSVNDERIHPWLAPEKRFIRDVIERGRAVLGVCLGAQLIAGALGSKVYANPVKEIGWFPQSLARQMVEHCRNELVPSTYVQSEAELLNAPPELYRKINQVMDQVLLRVFSTLELVL